ncbi:MAG: N-acetylmuramoyl-L-alanine amidase [Erysipelotrichaceae bacterium]|nr:N-acetylmuramoyl-L-alanine amidase [Erysipelotrichaceae bacterium]
MKRKHRKIRFGRIIFTLIVVVAIVIGAIKGGGLLLHLILNRNEVIEITNDTSQETTQETSEETIATVIIDPGHGGDDTGYTIESLDLYESQINLKAAQAVSSYLKENNVEVIMTRDSDTNIETDEDSDLAVRYQMSETYNADYFISIHVNDYDSEDSISGYEIYASGEESENLAQAILNQMDTLNYTDNLGIVDGSGIIVIANNTVPSILIELGYIQTDYDYLGDDEKLTALGQTIGKGIVNQINSSNKSSEELSEDSVDEITEDTTETSEEEATENE